MIGLNVITFGPPYSLFNKSIYIKAKEKIFQKVYLIMNLKHSIENWITLIGWLTPSPSINFSWTIACLSSSTHFSIIFIAFVRILGFPVIHFGNMPGKMSSTHLKIQIIFRKYVLFLKKYLEAKGDIDSRNTRTASMPFSLAGSIESFVNLAGSLAKFKNNSKSGSFVSSASLKLFMSSS
jgi:hypothetical protein